MDISKTVLSSEEVATPSGTFTVLLEEEDFSAVYPGMVRYTVSVTDPGNRVAVFRTNSYEYAPGVPLKAASVARQVMEEWTGTLHEDPQGFPPLIPSARTDHGPESGGEVVVIQGSPRAGGNCGIIAGWISERARSMGLTVQIIFPDELAIHPCIGCYQCYNTGVCTFTDDMDDVIRSLSRCTILAVCSPVYTNTVPGGLKILLDRCMAYHALRLMKGENTPGNKGILFAVAGREGQDNFRCVTHVVEAFFRNLGFMPSGRVLADSMDTHGDVRNVPGLFNDVRDLVARCMDESGPD